MSNVLIIQPFRKKSMYQSLVDNSPYYEVINSSPLILAAIVETQYEVEYLNLPNIMKSNSDHNWEKLDIFLNKFSPDIVIFCTDYYMSNGSTASLYSIPKIIKILKIKNPSLKVIYTGKNGEVLNKSMFNYVPDLDVVVKGEAENIILDILKFDNLSKIPNIIYKIKDNIYETKGIGIIKSFNELPLPAFSLLKKNMDYIEDFTGNRVRYLPISLRTSYGCPMSCNFCGGLKNWNRYRKFSIEYIENTVDSFIDTFGNKGKIFFLTDELFTVNKNHVKNIVEIFEKKNIKLSGLYSHTKYFDSEIAKLLKRITNTVFFGAENCSERVLSISNKNQKLEDIVHAAKIAHLNDLKVSLEWIVGLPGETVLTAGDNLNIMNKLLVNNIVDNINTYIFSPHPGTEFFNNYSDYGILNIGDFEDMIEEGGYPTYELTEMTKNQIYIYYLMSQKIITEAITTREDVVDIDYKPGNVDVKTFSYYFNKI